MNDMSVAPRQQGEGSAGTDDVYCLPQAIQNKHRLVESNVHTGQAQ